MKEKKISDAKAKHDRAHQQINAYLRESSARNTTELRIVERMQKDLDAKKREFFVLKENLQNITRERHSLFHHTIDLLREIEQINVRCRKIEI